MDALGFERGKEALHGRVIEAITRRLMDDWNSCRSSTARYGPEAYSRVNRLRVRLCAIPPPWGAQVPYRTLHASWFLSMADRLSRAEAITVAAIEGEVPRLRAVRVLLECFQTMVRDR
jgi:hypothetical protein